MTELKSANLREIDSFGARGDCTYDEQGRLVSGSDDSAALKDAFTWQQSGKGCKLLGRPGAIYLLMEEINGDEDLLVDWRGAEVFKASSGRKHRSSLIRLRPGSSAPRRERLRGRASWMPAARSSSAALSWNAPGGVAARIATTPPSSSRTSLRDYPVRTI